MEVNVEQKELARQLGFFDLDAALKREIIVDLHGLEIYAKTMTLIGGPSNSGKTVTCMHFCNECVKKNKSVLYFDTDDHPIAKRPDPNLLNIFREENPDAYQNFFFYKTSFEEDELLTAINTLRPALVVIDSIYAPFFRKHPSASMTRAKDIRRFLTILRDSIINVGCGVLLTSQVGKEIRTGDEEVHNILGGEGLKHLSDTKWILDFVEQGESRLGGKNAGKRVLMIDKQQEIVVEIGYGGKIEKVIMS